ncbi:MAG: hypothetical protein JEY71_10960 [Sphaerochaeta sp.]|nr:hypothetical protein [Sphaerochaeta sp.]
MSIGKIKKLLIAATILLSVVSFTGCDSSLQSSEVVSRKVSADSSQEEVSSKDNAKKTFSATVNLYQDHANLVTLDMGNSNHHKTIEETLYSYQYGPYGGTIVSDWDLLNGKNVVMTNVTNYNLDPVTGEISGSNHSVINIVDAYGAVVLSLQANGNLKGSLFGAEINMSLNSIKQDVKVNGKVSGTFVWMGINYQTGETYQILPNGTFTLTGTYR